MAKISAENRELFNIKIAPYKDSIKASQDKEKNILNLIQKDTSGVGYKKLLLCEEQIFIATTWITINNLSVELLDTKNNDALNDARKALYKSVIYLEDIVTSFIDCQYSEIEDKVAEIANTPLEKRFYLVKKLGLAIKLLLDAFGDNTKWKWSFVELEGRFATVAKNFINMKEALKDYFDPRSQDYETTVLYIRLIQKLLNDSATAYRDKYELSTRRIDDMRNGIKYLLALRKLYVALGNSQQAEEIKKKAVVWKDKMDADAKAGTNN